MNILSRANNSRSITSISILLVGGFLTLMFLYTFYAMEKLNQSLRQELDDSLVSINNTVNQSLNIWHEEHEKDITRLAKDRQVLSSIGDILTIQRNPEALLASNAQKILRERYSLINEDMHVNGFFVISPDGVNLASSGDANVGVRNVMVNAYPKRFDRVLMGEPVFIPPVLFDATRKNQSGNHLAKSISVFFSTPIVDASGKVIAILAIRIDPFKNFYFIFSAGRLEETGESYAIDGDAHLLTETRFNKQLGYIPGPTQTLKLAIRDPGGNLEKGYKPSNDDRISWPLTLMAREVLKRRSGASTTGYRDYRGVPVIGAWSWSEKLDMGLATEMDVSEALQPYYEMRSMMFGLLSAVTIFTLILSALIIFLTSSARKRLEQLVSERTHEIELLQRLASLLAACQSLTEAQQVISDVLPRLLGNATGAISLIHSSRNKVEVVLEWCGEWPAARSYSPKECWALRKGTFHFSEDEHSKLHCHHMREQQERQTLCIPLNAQGNTIGVMHLILANRGFTRESMPNAFTIAEHLSLTLTNIKLQEELRNQALLDPLTNLYNRRYLEETMGQELVRASRHKQSISFLMLDLDNFKHFNDNFGHDTGDYILKYIATTLRQGVRGEDVTSRVGGEEFAIVLPGTSHSAACGVANNLCTAVRNLSLNFRGRELGHLTLSIGVSSFPEDGATLGELMKSSDLALYAAKDQGRDQYQSCRGTIDVPPTNNLEQSTLTEKKNKTGT